MLLNNPETGNRLQNLLRLYGGANSDRATQSSMLAMANLLQNQGNQMQGLRPMNLNMGNYYAGPSGAEQGMNIFSKLVSGALSGAALGMTPGIADQTNQARESTLSEMLPYLSQFFKP